MKTYGIFLSVLIVFSLFGSIRFLEDNDFISEEIILHANIHNRNSENTMHNTRLRFIVLDDFGTRGVSSGTHVDPGKSTSKIAHSQHNLEPGEYWVRIYAYSDDGRRSIRHRPIIIQ
ncbi:MAG: hypothetical protein ACMXYG_01520 [Candidatus Woesearchaeota archaeon]